MILSIEQAATINDTVSLLMERSIPATHSLRQIKAAAISEEVDIKNVSIQEREIQISALSKALYRTAAFCDALETLDFIESAAVISIELVEQSTYSFKISGIYQTNGGSLNEKKDF